MKVTRLLLLSMFSSMMSFAGIITYTAGIMSGLNEVPPNGSPATGTAFVIVDDVAQTMEVIVTFSGLVAPNTAAHIHCCTAVPLTGNAGVATVTPTFTGFPTGTTAGTYDNTFDMTLASSYNPAFVTANAGSIPASEAALFAGMAAGKTYLNIHSTTFPGGEIRGFLVPTPEPGTCVLALAGLGALWAAKRKRA